MTEEECDLVVAMLGWEKVPADWEKYPQVIYALRLARGALAAGYHR